MNDYRISEMKVISSVVQPNNTNVLWLNNTDKKLYKFGNNGWESISGGNSGGGGIEIVDSIDKLDPNAELGSLASVVTPGSIQETSFRDLYQADESILDPNTYTLNTEDCSLVSGLSITPPLAPIESSSSIMLAFCTANMSLMDPVPGDIMAQLQFVPNADNTKLIGLGGVMMDVATQIQTEYILFSINDDGSVTVNQDQIDALNDVFANNELYYLGTFFYALEGASVPSDFYDVVDTSIQPVSGIPSITDIYIKEDKWTQLYKKNLDKLTSDLDKTKTTVENKADKISIAAYSSYKGLQPNVYTTYTISYMGSFTIKLAAIADTTIYNEYILELKCTSTPSSVAFNNADGTAATIVWANGIEPTFEAGMTYLISIVNGFGVYSTFPNS